MRRCEARLCAWLKDGGWILSAGGGWPQPCLSALEKTQDPLSCPLPCPFLATGPHMPVQSCQDKLGPQGTECLEDSLTT